MATITERLELLIDAKTGGAISGLKAVTAETKNMGTAQTKSTGITGKMEGGLQKLGFSSEAAGTALKAGVATGAIVAAGALVKFGKDSVAATAAVGTSILALQRATGATAETADKLVAITDDYGISAEAATKSFAKLAVNIANHKQVLADDGIETVKNKNGQIDFEKTLLNVADAYKQSGGGAEGLKIATDAFGKSGKDLIPILEQGRKGIKEMFDAVPKGQIFSQDDLSDVEAYNLAMDNLSDAVHELQYAIGRELIPILSQTANRLADITHGATEANAKLKELTGINILPKLVQGPVSFGFDDAGKVGDAFSATTKLAGAQKQLEESTKTLTELRLNGQQGTKAYAEAQKLAQESSETLTHAQKGVAKALEDTVPAADKAKSKMEETAAANFALLDATLAVTNSQLGLRGALLNVESALVAVDKVNADAEATDLDRAEAQLRLEQSVTAVAAAADVQYAAQVKLAGGTENAYDKAQAQIVALEDLKAKFPELIPVIEAHIWRLSQIQETIVTRLVVDSWDAEAAAGRFLSLIRDIKATGGAKFSFGFGSSIPEGAEGAIVSRPMLALIGEAGPEAVVPLNKMPGAGPVPDWSGGSSRSSGGGSITIQIPLNGRVIAEATVSELNRAGGPRVSAKAITN